MRVAFRDLQQLSDGVLVMQGQRRDAGPVTVGMQRQLEVPHRREDRAVQAATVTSKIELFTGIALLDRIGPFARRLG